MISASRIVARDLFSENLNLATGAGNFGTKISCPMWRTQSWKERALVVLVRTWQEGRNVLAFSPKCWFWRNGGRADGILGIRTARGVKLHAKAFLDFDSVLSQPFFSCQLSTYLGSAYADLQSVFPSSSSSSSPAISYLGVCIEYLHVIEPHHQWWDPHVDPQRRSSVFMRFLHKMVFLEAWPWVGEGKCMCWCLP